MVALRGSTAAGRGAQPGWVGEVMREAGWAHSGTVMGLCPSKRVLTQGDGPGRCFPWEESAVGQQGGAKVWGVCTA